MPSLFEDHLNLDAVVAFADGEMSMTAFQRAAAHIAHCQACATEVAEQTSARQQLRSAACPSIPNGLLDALCSIPVALPAAPPPAGVSRDVVTGRAVRDVPVREVTDRPGTRPLSPHEQPLRSREQPLRSREQSLPSREQTLRPHEQPLRPHGQSPRSRGFRLGAGAIVAGLAVGAIAVTAVAERPTEPASPAGPDTAQVSVPAASSAGSAVLVAARAGR